MKFVVDFPVPSRLPLFVKEIKEWGNTEVGRGWEDKGERTAECASE